MGNSFEYAVDRIKKIDFNKGESERNSVTMLFLEYLRRMSVFVRYINNGENLTTSFLVHATREVGSDLEIDVIDYRPRDIYNTGFIIADCILGYYLEWCKLIDDENEIALRFPDLYEPLIKFLEYGGWIYREHGIIDIYKCTLWSNFDFGKVDFGPIDISEKSLKLYDKQVLCHRAFIK